MSDASHAFLALYAEDAFSMAQAAAGSLLNPAADPRLPPVWAVEGTLTGRDVLFGPGSIRLQEQTVFYGWLLRNAADEFVVAIRGTGDALEWGIDGEFEPQAVHPVAGKVETGFWSVFESLQIDGQPFTNIAKIIAGRPVTVVGHSLGAAIATYGNLALVQAGADAGGVFIASPHPGDGEFATAFDAAVGSSRYVMYRNETDVVPNVPFWFGYSDVPHTVSLSAAKARVAITGGLPGQHHILSYIAMIDRLAFKAFQPLPIDQKFLDCVQLL